MWKCGSVSRCASCPQESPACFRAGGVMAAMSDVLVLELSAGFPETCFIASLKSLGTLFITESNNECRN